MAYKPIKKLVLKPKSKVTRSNFKIDIRLFSFYIVQTNNQQGNNNFSQHLFAKPTQEFL